MKHRELAKILHVKGPHVEPDHGILTVDIRIGSRDGGWSQGFAGLAFGSDGQAKAEAFMASLRATFSAPGFRVRTDADLVGLNCYALYAFTYYNAPIVGLEAESGERFLLNEWRDAHFPQKNGVKWDDLSAEIETRKNRIESFERQVREETLHLSNLKADYKDWSAA